MQDCDWCNLSEQDKRFLLYDSPFWSVFLSDEQDYIGIATPGRRIIRIPTRLLRWFARWKTA